MSSPIFELSERAVEAMADADPLLATYAGLAGRDDRWPDMSPDGIGGRRDLAAALRNEAEACATDGADDELARRVLVDDLDEHLERHGAGDQWRDLNSITSTFQGVHDVFGVMSEPDDVASRLSTVDEVLGGWRETLSEGLTHGVAVARRQVLAAVEQGRAWSTPEGFAEQAVLPGCAGPAEAARRAYADAADWLEREYLPRALDADAVGEDRYLREARSHLGTTIDVAEVHAWGWEEVRRLAERIQRECAAVAPDGSVAEAIDILRQDPQRAAGSADEFLAVMQERQSTALEHLAGTHFLVDERFRRIEVKAAPPGGALAPRYTPPSEDFSRAGCVWYPLGDRSTFPLWEEVSTAHHEGFPGHHLQVGTQMALGDRLSRYHRTMVWKPGSGEGWALYAEQLMAELGYLERPDYLIGMLAAQMFRACRIVIDTGLHLDLPIPDDAPFRPGTSWSPDSAVDMLCQMAFLDRALAVSEVTRYLGWPAQAISYKLGERAILELRDERRAAGTLDPVAFHSDVLRVGAVGLDLLADQVRA